MTLFRTSGESFKSLPSIANQKWIDIYIVKNYHYKIRTAMGLKKYQITNTLHLQMEDLKLFADFA